MFTIRCQNASSGLRCVTIVVRMQCQHMLVFPCDIVQIKQKMKVCARTELFVLPLASTVHTIVQFAQEC